MGLCPGPSHFLMTPTLCARTQATQKSRVFRATWSKQATHCMELGILKILPISFLISHPRACSNMYLVVLIYSTVSKRKMRHPSCLGTSKILPVGYSYLHLESHFPRNSSSRCTENHHLILFYTCGHLSYRQLLRPLIFLSIFMLSPLTTIGLNLLY